MQQPCILNHYYDTDVSLQITLPTEDLPLPSPSDGWGSAAELSAHRSCLRDSPY